MISVGNNIPCKNKAIMVSSGAVKSKVDLLDACKLLHANGYTIYATLGTQQFLIENGVAAKLAGWPDETKGINVMQLIAEHKFDFIINVPKNNTRRELTNGYKIRRAAIDHNIPLITNARLASAFIIAFTNKKLDEIKIKAWNEY